MYTIVGLGNPGKEYENTRHNTGRIVLAKFLKDFCDEFEDSKKHKALVAKGGIGKEKIMVLFPETFMNKSGASVVTAVSSVKKAEQLVVVYDDLDLGLGSMKISFNRGSGGHRGVESIIRGLKTEAFVRVRIGISKTTPSGKIKKPKGGKEVEKHILGKYSAKEMDVLKRISKKASQAIEAIVIDGRETAMTVFNK